MLEFSTSKRITDGMGKEKIITNLDLVRGVAEVGLDTVKRAGAGLIHLATQQFQNPTPSEHHFEHPVTDRPATYAFPHDSEGGYFDDAA